MLVELGEEEGERTKRARQKSSAERERKNLSVV
jgi:hypothetical protein